MFRRLFLMWRPCFHVWVVDDHSSSSLLRAMYAAGGLRCTCIKCGARKTTWIAAPKKGVDCQDKTS